MVGFFVCVEVIWANTHVEYSTLVCIFSFLCILTTIS